MSQLHLCFFSTRCPFSQAFLEALSKTTYSREFRFICVDAQPGRPRPQLPAYVKSVPTLMINGEREPRTESAVMNWLSERRLSDKSTAPTTARGTVGNIESSQGGPSAMSDDMCMSGDEGFCYINEMEFKPTGSQGGRLAGNMVSFNDPIMGGPAAQEAVSMGAAGGGRGSNGMSAKSKALDDAMTRLQAQRDSDFKGVQRR